MRIEATVKNSVWGIIYHLVYIILGFVSRVIFIRILGIEYYGINGLFVSVITILSMADLGIGWAIAYNLYEPLAKDDREVIAGLMKFFRKCYYAIALLIMLVGVIISPFVGELVHTSFQVHFIRLIFLIVIFENAISYLFSYKTILLIADQKNYVSTIFETLINFFQLLVRIVFLVITKDYIVYLISGIIIKVLGNLIRSRYVDRMYSYINEKSYGPLSPERIQKVFRDAKSILVNKVCTTSIGAVSNIFIAWCGGPLGVIKVGYYTNYQLILNVVNGLAGQFTNSYQASLGNLYVLDGKERAYDIFKKSTFISFWISSFCMCCLIGLIHPFIVFWMGSNSVIMDYTIEIAVINFGLTILFDPLNRVVNAAGLFKKDKYFAITEAGINIFGSLCLMKHFGMIGIFIGAFLGLFISSVLRGKYLLREYFSKKPSIYFSKMALYIGFIGVNMGITWLICYNLLGFSGLASFFLRMVICMIIPNFICYFYFRKSEEFIYFLGIIEVILNRFLRRKAKNQET